MYKKLEKRKCKKILHFPPLWNPLPPAWGTWEGKPAVHPPEGWEVADVNHSSIKSDDLKGMGLDASGGWAKGGPFL